MNCSTPESQLLQHWEYVNVLRGTSKRAVAFFIAAHLPQYLTLDLTGVPHILQVF